MSAHFLRPLLEVAAHDQHLGVAGRHPALATTIETAFDSASRRKGLLGRDALPTSTALVIAPCGAVHTFGMRFSVDVLFAARDGRILKIAPHLKPGRIAVCLRAFAAIELEAGACERAGLRAGDVLTLQSVRSL